MRFEDLFADLAGQAEVADAADRASEVAERTRAGVGRLGLVDGWGRAIGATVTLRVLGAGGLRGVLRGVGADWLVLSEEGGGAALVSLSAVLAAAGVGGRVQPPGSAG